MRASTICRAASYAVLAAALGLIALCLAWRADGGRWERVETPSMGTVAPVGTLLWVKPTDIDRLRPGDFISFHPPGRADQTYSHLVYRRHQDGTVSTKGVIPGPDPWRLHAADVVGTVRMSWWGVGWLVTAAPVLVVGGLGVAVVRVSLRRAWRPAATLLLGSVVLTVAIVWYRPLVGAQQVAFAPVAGGGADATYVGTGLLPIRLQAHGGGSVVLHDGEVGTVHVSARDDAGRLRVSLRPAIAPWWWLALVMSCFVPALYALVVGLPPPGRERTWRRRIHDHARDHARDRASHGAGHGAGHGASDRSARPAGGRARARRHAADTRRGRLRGTTPRGARPV